MFSTGDHLSKREKAAKASIWAQAQRANLSNRVDGNQERFRTLNPLFVSVPSSPSASHPQGSDARQPPSPLRNNVYHARTVTPSGH